MHRRQRKAFSWSILLTSCTLHFLCVHVSTHTHTNTHTPTFLTSSIFHLWWFFFEFRQVYLYIKWKNYVRCSTLVGGGGVSRSTIYGGDQLWEGEQLASLSNYFSTRNLHFWSILVPVTSESLKSTRVVRLCVWAHTYTRVCVWREHEVKLTKVDKSTSQVLLRLYQQWFSTRIYGSMRTHLW